MENQLYFRQHYMLRRQPASFLIRISGYQLSERDGLPRLYEEFREVDSGDADACLSTFQQLRRFDSVRTIRLDLSSYSKNVVLLADFFQTPLDLIQTGVSLQLSANILIPSVHDVLLASSQVENEAVVGYAAKCLNEIC